MAPEAEGRESMKREVLELLKSNGEKLKAYHEAWVKSQPCPRCNNKHSLSGYMTCGSKDLRGVPCIVLKTQLELAHAIGVLDVPWLRENRMMVVKYTETYYDAVLCREVLLLTEEEFEKMKSMDWYEKLMSLSGRKELWEEYQRKKQEAKQVEEMLHEAHKQLGIVRRKITLTTGGIPRGNFCDVCEQQLKCKLKRRDSS